VARARGGAVVVTEKDWVKLARFDWGSTPVWVARLEVRLLGEDDDGSWILQRG
jgi:tetraacyldisaccharide-1-P 4'-kinase